MVKSWALAVFLVFALERLTNTTADPDLWGYLAFGRLFWDSGRFPYQDVFSYVPTLKPWIYHEWLTGVLLSPLYQALGAPGLQLLKYCLGLATLGLMYLTARKRRAGFWGIILTLFLIQGFLVSGYSPVRAQVFTYALFALSLYLLEEARLSGRWWVLGGLIPIQVFWCNLHGGFLAGLGLTFMYAVGQCCSRRRFLPYVGAFLLSGAATLINPYGLDYWRYLFAAVSMPRPEITEWVSIYQAYQTGAPLGDFLYFAGVLLITVFLAIRLRWREFTPILALGLTAYLGLKHQRHQVFFLILAGAYLPSLLTVYLKEGRNSGQFGYFFNRLGWKMPAILGLIGSVLLGYNVLIAAPLSLNAPPGPGHLTRSRQYYPAGALKYIETNHLSGNLLTDFNWGEYLLWHLYPRCRVALDGRFETVYPASVCQKYFDFIYARKNWRQFLENYPPDMILIDSRTQIFRLLEKNPSWRQVYRDAGCALFIGKGNNPTANKQESHEKNRHLLPPFLQPQELYDHRQPLAGFPRGPG